MNDEVMVNLTIPQARELLGFLGALVTEWRAAKRYEDATDLMMFMHDIETLLREAGE